MTAPALAPKATRYDWLHNYRGEEVERERDRRRILEEELDELRLAARRLSSERHRRSGKGHAATPDELAQRFGRVLITRVKVKRHLAHDLGCSERELNRWVLGTSFPGARFRSMNSVWQKHTGLDFLTLISEALLWAP